MTSETSNFSTGRDQLNVFKHDEIKGYCSAFILAGLRLVDNGIAYVGSDDVTTDTDSPGIAGSAITMLRSAHVISDYFGSHPEEKIYGGRRKSKRPSANGRKISLYMLNRSLAETWLAKNGVAFKARQTLLAI